MSAAEFQMKIAITYDVRRGREIPGKGFIWLLADVNTASLDWPQNMRAGCDEVKSKTFLNARDLLMVVQELKKKINQMRGCEMFTFIIPYVRGTRLGVKPRSAAPNFQD